MSDALAPQTAENLRRWQQSGAPRRWADAHPGGWGHDDWLALLNDLRSSPYWPLDADAVGLCLEEAARRRQNLRRWERSGQARAWVLARGGAWNHADWLALLEALARSPFWPLDPDAVGEVLEEIRREWANLRRWEETGGARRWLEARGDRWDPADWPALQEALRGAGCWPVDVEAAEGLLRRLADASRGLRRWQESGEARAWVEAHEGRWGHDDWLALLEALRREYGPLDVEAVGRVLEDVKAQWWNLRRWRASGLARRWVDQHGGRWQEADLAALPDELRRLGMWPVDRVALVRVLEEVRVSARNLRRWRQSGQPLAWVAARRGRWRPGDVRSLLDSLRRSEFWPLDPQAVGRLLEEVRPSVTPAIKPVADRAAG